MSPCDSPSARQRRAVIWRSASSSRPFGISPALPLHRPIKRAPVRFCLDRRCCTGGVRSQISTPHARSPTRRSYWPALATWRPGPGFRATRRRCTLASAISDQQSQDRPSPSRNIGCVRELKDLLPLREAAKPEQIKGPGRCVSLVCCGGGREIPRLSFRRGIRKP